MTVRERVAQAGRWLASRSARWYLFAGWIFFILACYPGYLSVDSTLQLYQVRSGNYSDAFPPVMTFVWSVCENVLAGPFPMILVQSGLFLFGLAALLRTVVTPRVAALAAVCVLLFPPVYATMAVVWPDPLMAGCLLAGAGALVQRDKRWQMAGLVALVVACGCRPEILLAVIPIVLLAVPAAPWWKRLALALGVTVVLAGAARLAEWGLTDVKTWEWQQRLMLTDTVSTVRRLHLKEGGAAKAFAGMAIVDVKDLPNRLSTKHDAFDWYPLAHGDKRPFDLVTSDDGEAALATAWKRTIKKYPSSYLKHRELVVKGLLLLDSHAAMFESFGDVELLAPLHHRAIASGWQEVMRAWVHAVGATPLFRPIIWVLVALGVVIVERKRRSIAKTLAASCLLYLATLAWFSPAVEYRLAHWLVIAGCAAGVALLAAWRWPAQSPSR
ncbi:MAG TPA: hypothetical protein VFQ65_11450 [Kofleriaceae bacterium]|nr:hypothetical protein [Kofleriaceae bacterium]